MVKLIAAFLNGLSAHGGNAKSKRTPDLLVEGLLALEFKIAHSFGDNGREAEN